MEKNITAICDALAKRRKPIMEILPLNIFNLINYLWDFCIYDVFLIRLAVGLTIVVALPYFLLDIMEKQYKDDDYMEIELSESSETTEESNTTTSSMFECTICTESVPLSRVFTIDTCWHVFCFSCMRNYITSKLHENIVKIKCPDGNCNELLDPDECKGIIPSHLFDRWGIALCELTLGAKKFYCPFQDCSLLLIHDDDGVARATNITCSECPKCCRLFCAKCKVPWHAGMVCAKYQKLRGRRNEEEDRRMLQNLAAKKRWQKCPNCKIYVERIDGCKLIKCRCGYCFCYTCGAYMRTHNCNKCTNR